MNTNNLPKLPSLPKIRQQNPCECGCGATTGNRFAPGHDSKQNGLIKRIEAGVMTIEDVEDWGGVNVAKATARAMGLTWPIVTEKVG